jgi:hypothetical protein
VDRTFASGKVLAGVSSTDGIVTFTVSYQL